jgi:archaellum component FlaC
VDLSPVYERLDSIEEQLTSPPEAVAATAAPVESEALEALQTRLDALAQQVADAAASEDGGDSDGEDLSVVLDRLDVLESRNPTVGDLEADPDRLDSIEARLGAVEQQEPSAGSADAERIEALEASVAGLGVQPQAAGGKGGMLLAVIALVIGLVAGGIGAKAFMDVGAASDGLGKRIDAVDTGISGLDTRVSANETALKSQGDTLAALDGIDNTVNELTTRLSTVGDDLAKRIDLSETALDGLGTRLGTFDTRLGSLDGELSGLEGKIGELGSALEALPDPAEAIQVLRDQVTALRVKLDELANRAVNTGLNSILGGGDSDNGSAPAEGDAAE